jgi:dTDP-4-amino-4,6-dideoxygalactose transaminase
MSAILADIKPGDEVIIPSYTFVSTANAFALRGANIRFADSRDDNPNIDANRIEELINNRTKAIVPVHYAGIACDMDKILELAAQQNLIVIEDAAQAIDSYYNEKPLGGIGHLGTFSFHETKNIVSGEGGLLSVNDERLIQRAEIIWEKGTNRAAFYRGEINKYGWVDIGSSFLPGEVISAFLYAQLEHLDQIQNKRKAIWQMYYEGFEELEQMGICSRPIIPSFATNNAHMFYMVFNEAEDRNNLMAYLKFNGISTVFHYISLHKSEYYNEKHDGRSLPNSDRYTECLLRFPMFYDLKLSEVEEIIEQVLSYFKNVSYKQRTAVTTMETYSSAI